MKRLLAFFVLLLGWATGLAQISPYFYPKNIYGPAVTNITHLKFLKKVHFFPRPDSRVNNVVDTHEDGSIKSFNPDGVIEFTFYLEHPLQYFYDTYLHATPADKEKWDNSEAVNAKDHSVAGRLAIVYKVNGKEIGSSVLMLDRHQVKSSSFSDFLWHVDTRQTWQNEKLVDISLEEKYIAIRPKGTRHLPLMCYFLKNAVAGEYKIEMEVYPVFYNGEKATDRSNEVLAKGEFTFVLNAKQAAELKKIKDPQQKMFDQHIYHDAAYGGFTMF